MLKTFGFLKSLNPTRVIMVLIYIDALCFVFAASVLIQGWDFVTEHLCRTAIYICLVFYVGDKVLLYLFLVERIRMTRKQTMPRLKDIVTLISLAVVVLGFGIIAVFAFMDPVTALSQIDGKCRIGLPLIVTLPLLTYDILINFGFSFLFVFYGCRQIRNRSGFLDTFKLILNAVPGVRFYITVQDQDTAKKVFILKSLLGASAIIIPTVANLAILFKLNGHEQGWLCFTICTIDGTLSPMLFIHRCTSPLIASFHNLPPCHRYSSRVCYPPSPSHHFFAPKLFFRHFSRIANLMILQ